MTTSLSQSATGSPPQLPGSTVLRIDTANDAGVLLHDLGSAQSLLYARLMIDPSQADNGDIAVVGGIDDNGQWAWQLTLDADSQSVQLDAGTGQCAATLASSIAWHTVEVGLNTSTGAVTLRIDGIERDTTTATLSATRYAWVGGAFFTDGLTGTIGIDNVVLATAPIGVAIASAQDDHAGDPRRWLVVYNRDNDDSAAWADTYRQRRGVPYTNLCGLSLPTTETITAAEYQALRQQISEYLDDNNLGSQIVGVLLGLGVPGYADILGQGTLTPIASYLHTDDSHGTTVVNPLYQNPIANRPSAGDYTTARLTGRIDAASLADAIELIDRADAVMAQALAYDGSADFVIDINPDNVNVGPVYTQPVEDWARGDGLARLRLPAIVYDAAAPLSVSNESVVWGWRDAAPPSGFFGSPAGRRALCLQFDPEPDPAVTVRSASATDWLSTALQAGYAAAGAPSRAYSLSSLPLPELVFEPLRLGWTLAEAWAVGQPFLRDGLQIVGDPLMTIGLPKAGYDVFGPVDRLDQIDFTQPIGILHDGGRSFTLDPADAPPTGSAARYLVRRIDPQGRADRGSASAYAAIEQGESVRPALPAWPNADGWRVAERGGRARLTALWPDSLALMAVDRVELYAQVGTDDPVLVEQQPVVTGGLRHLFEIDLPAESTRYRFRLVQGAAEFDTPWSQWVQPVATTSETLTLLETPS